MIEAEIDGKKMKFRSEAALARFQAQEDSRTPEAVRQFRHRRNERRAAIYWLWRIKHGRELPGLIVGVSETVLNQQRAIAIDAYPAHVKLYPERVTE